MAFQNVVGVRKFSMYTPVDFGYSAPLNLVSPAVHCNYSLAPMKKGERGVRILVKRCYMKSLDGRLEA